MPTFARSILAGAAFVLCSAGAAAAYPATVTQDLHLRAGPGTSYRVVETMPGGVRVNVRNCLSNGWCHLSYAGISGYASGNYLAGARRGSSAVIVETLPSRYYIYADRYPPYWRAGYFHYWYGGHWRRVQRNRAWWDHHRHAIEAHRHHRAQRHHRAAQHHRAVRQHRAIRHDRRQLHHAQAQQHRVHQRLKRTHHRVQRLQRNGASHRRVTHARRHQQHLRNRAHHSRSKVHHRKQQLRHDRHHR
jgi:uncharacterized protein YraI